MAFATTAIRYGWVALVSLGVITGTTIYVLDNTRKQVKPEDIIELALGVHERCLATQYQTNPVAYWVTPPSFVRTWYSNVYTTNGVTIYTNIVTNTIGWHIDRDMMVSLDTTISNLIPYYVDTNTVYSGSTNIVLLTVTGLWAALQIGDKTNKFTSTPCWINQVQTNYLICYTSYWPTNGATFPTTNNYTSTVNGVINYGTNWDGTNVGWGVISNWPSEVVQTTNAATYGDYPWQIYTEDLEERYKVLNALRITEPTSPDKTHVLANGDTGYGDMHTNYPALYDMTISQFTTNQYSTTNNITFDEFDDISLVYEAQWSSFYMEGGNYEGWRRGAIASVSVQITDSSITTQIESSVCAYGKATTCEGIFHYVFYVQTNRFNDNSYSISTNIYTLMTTISNEFFLFDPHTKIPTEGTVPDVPSATEFTPDLLEQWEVITGFMVKDIHYLRNWQFNYCTNKYW